MNRVIKFRGIASYGDLAGKWVYGSLVYDYDKETFISVSGYGHTGSAFSGCYKVLPETVGQFTGLKDKNDREIYEGDILGAKGVAIGWVKGGVRGYCYDVVYINHPAGESRWTLYSTVKDDYPEQIEVIGNIYDNFELLKGGNYGTQDKH